jgi:hypothetical protein
MNEILHPNGCSEKYAELCALSTSGDLSREEWRELSEHLAVCADCARLEEEYRNLAEVAMARLAAEAGPEEDHTLRFHAWTAERRLEEALSKQTGDLIPAERKSTLSFRKRVAVGISAAAALILAVGGGVEVGRRLPSSPSPAQPIAKMPSSTALSSHEKEALEARMALVEKSLADTERRAVEDEKRIVDLTSSRSSLMIQVGQLTKSSQMNSTSLASVSEQRDNLAQQLSETNRNLEQVKADLVEARLDRQGAVLKAANLEQEVNTLHATLASADRSVSTDEQFLAKDRDIRDLMGARQLYIADVLDVQHDGRPSKPFGRVFYTKGKSLIFYAFDLQSQPGYHEAKAFQAWGRPDGGSSKPLSLGIFYMDSEQNKRWVVKSANSDVLARINAVFVTVEPKGGSHEPTGKPFLEAYLHSLPPNHP